MGKNGGNGCNNNGHDERKITCCRCNEKFPIKIGKNKDDYTRTVNCPHCRAVNRFSVNESGKVHVVI